MKERTVIQWHITHRCNLRCVHCYQEDYKEEPTEKQLLQYLQEIEGYCKAYDRVAHINITGGEPLVSEHFFWLLNKLQEATFVKSFGILSNGTLLQEAEVRKMATYEKLSFVQISIDGGQATHERIRGEGTYKKAFDALKRLRKRKIQTMVSFTANRSNVGELKQVIRECAVHRVDRFWSDRVVPIGTATKEELALSTEEFLKYVRTLYACSEWERKNPFSGLRVHTNRALQFFGDCDVCDGYYCAAGRSLFAILADGEVYACRRLELPLGNLKQSSFVEIVENSHSLVEAIHELPKECKNCRYVSKCNAGAKCISYAVYGDFAHPDVNCPIREAVTQNKK